ncbi:hypothetical protein ERJ75_000380500 [Trypanosoma vivax]|uniref:Uncharacterized protein n=1 Tax=Trypanosoma vivax (strain Y486) TaxID=1055687 RepID=G0TRW2_TRYVY|nr:hypothetical protein TRVL_05864 [Trypanosoma vivax]KAH8617429.1 hypothetical protein ERJ75_000380500 [Trypanosoma vivax]CCC46685.1 conserved hypothetical protein [Trypanosoma vivax Y486]
MSNDNNIGREFVNCFTWKIEEYSAVGNFTSSMTICCGPRESDVASSKHSSSKRSSSTLRRQRRKRQQLQEHLAHIGAEEDMFRSAPCRQTSVVGRSRHSIKTPFVSSAPGAPYNKKLRKKIIRRQSEPFSAPFASEATVGVDRCNTSSYFISPAHRVVAESTTPWSAGVNEGDSSGLQYQFFGHGGISGSAPSPDIPHRPRKRMAKRKKIRTMTRRGDCFSSSDESFTLDVTTICAGARSLGPMPTPSIALPCEPLPPSNAEVCEGSLVELLLETDLGADDLVYF